MNGNKLLIDSNNYPLSSKWRQNFSRFLQSKQIYISIISEMELLSFSGITVIKQKQIHEFLKQCKIVNINSEIKSETIKFRKKFKTKLPDSIIAATSVYLDIPLITADLGFKKIDKLQLIQYDI